MSYDLKFIACVHFFAEGSWLRERVLHSRYPNWEAPVSMSSIKSKVYDDRVDVDESQRTRLDTGADNSSSVPDEIQGTFPPYILTLFVAQSSSSH